MISIVCVFNDYRVLKRWLLNSLDAQTTPYVMHLIDNTNGRFKSAAEALNYGGGLATGDYIMFVHQDISLTASDWLETMESVIKTLPALGVAGVAGTAGRGRPIGNVEYCNYTAKVFDRFTEPVRVQTVDECIAIVPRVVFEHHKFNESICQDWHLYVVEYCLRLQLHEFNTYVVPQYVYHRGGPNSNNGLSRGAKYLPDGYYSTLKLVLDEFRANHRTIYTVCGYSTIYTTCGIWNTRIPIKLQRLKVWGRIRQRVREACSLVSKRDRLARVCGVAIRTKLGRLLTPRIVIESNAQDIYDLARVRTHETLRSELWCQDQFERDVLTPTEINEHLMTLRLLTRELNLKRVLELGVCDGKSTIALLHAAQEIGGHVTSMDIEDCPIARKRVWSEKLTHLWEFIVGDDIEVEWNQPIDHLFIDTSHAYDHTVSELRKFAPFVVPGGLITLHDTISFPGVRKAVMEFLEDNPGMRYYPYCHNNGLAIIFKGE